LTDLRPPTLAGDRATAVVDAARDALVTAFRVSLAASAVLALMSSAVSAWAFRAGPVSPGE
jgi:hypothetical protein